MLSLRNEQQCAVFFRFFKAAKGECFSCLVRFIIVLIASGIRSSAVFISCL